MFFWLKKIVEALCQPLPVGMGLMLVGFLLSWSRKHTRLGGCAMILGPLVILLFGYPLGPALLHKSLAGRYQPITTETLNQWAGRNGDAQWIVVLCGGYTTNAPVSVGARLNESSLARFIEGVRLYRQLPKGKILLSVGDLSDKTMRDRLLDQLAETVGIPRHDVRPVFGAACTQDEAALIRKIVGTAPFILVTSDYHMPRAMILFESLGMHPIPAPAGPCGQTDDESRFSPGSLFPSAANLSRADGAIHEYLGILWAEIRHRGRIRQ